ncbi:MAG: cysteine synthase family protein [Bacilli bacterium]|nr:cysteine synthase family protein [Bacilli bacterium]
MNIERLIGNTPMIEIKVKYKEKVVNVFAKLEYYNYTGSIKDRLAYYIINESYKDGSLKKGQPIVEATSGNTGISFAALGAYFGHEVHIFMPDWASRERIEIMKLYGAKVYLVSKEDGGFREAIRRADELAETINGFRPNQFDNIKNIEVHYRNTGLEIVNNVSKIDGMVSGIGTGGTLMGIAKRIKEVNKNAKVVALEPEQMPIMSKGISTGSHKIEGIGDDFIPSIVDRSIIDEVVTVDDEDAINMSRILASKFGLGVGISSGANLIASVISAEDNDNIVTTFADDFKKYLTTDLVKEINFDKSLISNQIEIISITNVDSAIR